MRKRMRWGQGIPRQVAQVRADIERWRGKREKRSPMPEPLWSAAVSLAREFTVCSVARALRLDYKALRSRTTTGANAAANFIELHPPIATPMPAIESILELTDSAGMKIALRRTGGADIDALRLVEIFRQPPR